MKKELRIIYMGTPEFACAGLEILLHEKFNIVGVITAPDKKSGRGQKLNQSPVKELALRHKLNILQPTNLKSPEFLKELRDLNANLQIVVAFRMLPEAVWDLPSIGTFNLHASLLPQYRGAAPINWALINGETKTGVTTFFLKHEIDTGDILFQEEIDITPKDNAGTLYQKLMQLGANTILKTTKAIELDNYQSVTQKDTLELKNAPKIFKETGEINWESTSKDVHNLIRGLSPYPVAWTTLKGKKCKIFESKITDIASTQPPGSTDTDGKRYFRYHTNDFQLEIVKIQLEGKKQMNIQDFLRGFQL